MKLKLAYTLYQLEARSSLNACSSVRSRTGLLLKVASEAGHIGYGDCHPWPELGDPPIEAHIDALKNGKMTPFLKLALSSAQIDAAARFEGKHLLQGKVVPESHFFVNNPMLCTLEHIQKAVDEGFTHIKLKMGRDFEAESKQLLTLFSQIPLKIRLDFNEKLNLAQFTQFLDQITSLRQNVDFIEDPIPFHADQWRQFQQQGWTLACDRQVMRAYQQSDAAGVLIIKPTVYSPELFSKETSQRKVVTANLAHPIEQISVAYAATLIDPVCLETHGLLSHRAYYPNSFSSQLNWCGPLFSLPIGTGVGFDEQLAALPWKEI